ncbi:MAG: hypothetical protein AAF402_13755 [Pseudomonadota bacterium]
MIILRTTAILLLPIVCSINAFAIDTPIFDRDSIYGTWTTSYGTMFIGQSTKYVAEYSSDGGRIVGNSSDRTVSGFWVENGSAEKCDSQKDGSFHWGRFEASFNADFTVFSGKWGYCNKPATQPWNGSRAAAERIAETPIAQQAGCPFPSLIAELEKNTRDGINRKLRTFRRAIDDFEKNTRPKLCIDNTEASMTLSEPNYVRMPFDYLRDNLKVYAAAAPVEAKAASKLLEWLLGKILDSKDRIDSPEAAWQEYQDIQAMRKNTISNLETTLKKNMCRYLPELEKARTILAQVDQDAVLANSKCNNYQRSDAVYKAQLISEQLKREFRDLLPNAGGFDAIKSLCS